MTHDEGYYEHQYGHNFTLQDVGEGGDQVWAFCSSCGAVLECKVAWGAQPRIILPTYVSAADDSAVDGAVHALQGASAEVKRLEDLALGADCARCELCKRVFEVGDMEYDPEEALWYCEPCWDTIPDAETASGEAPK